MEEVTYYQYLDILNIQQDKGWNNIDRAVKLLAALTDNPTDAEDAFYNDLDSNNLIELAKEIQWIEQDFTKLTKKIKPNSLFEINGKKYTFKEDFNKLSLNEESAVEELMKNKNLHAHQIALGILVREVKDNGKASKFNLDFINFVMFELVKDLKLIDFYSTVVFFFSWREEILSKYEGLYNKEKINVQGMTQDEIESMNKELEEEERNGFGRWGWFGVYYQLSNGDITKFEEVGKQNFILVLNFLSYVKEKEIEENKNKPKQ